MISQFTDTYKGHMGEGDGSGWFANKTFNYENWNVLPTIWLGDLGIASVSHSVSLADLFMLLIYLFMLMLNKS